MSVIRRVVVAIDAADRTARVVREAVRVASCFEAEVEGLIVEDVEVLELAAHSFARRVGSEARARSFDAVDVEREWAALAPVVRHALEREAARRRVRSPPGSARARTPRVPA